MYTYYSKRDFDTLESTIIKERYQFTRQNENNLIKIKKKYNKKHYIMFANSIMDHKNVKKLKKKQKHELSYSLSIIFYNLPNSIRIFSNKNKQSFKEVCELFEAELNAKKQIITSTTYLKNF